MSAETDIDDLDNDMSDEAVDNMAGHAKNSKSVGYKALGLATLFAALMGTAGGTVLSKVTSPAAPNLSPIQTQLESVLSENKGLKAQTSRLERDMKQQKAQIKAAAALDLSGIETRLSALENAEPQDKAVPIDSDLVARLEALQNEGSRALDLSGILTRLDALEARTQNAKPWDDAERQVLLEDLKSDLMTDQNLKRRDENLASPVTIVPPDGLPSFPAAAILAALSKDDKSGWVKRTLNKRITVQSNNNPRYLIELIEADLEAGHVSEALAKYDKLPELAKSAAKEWHAAVKDIQ